MVEIRLGSGKVEPWFWDDRSLSTLVTERPREPTPKGAEQATERDGFSSTDEFNAHTVPRQRGRRIPAHVRRAVFERDMGRCTYVDSSGRRCEESHRLELHHLVAFALSGEHSESNLTLRCQAHNREPWRTWSDAR